MTEEGINMALYCQQGSSTLPQQLLMMHGIACYCMAFHGNAWYGVVLHGASNCLV